jgi:catechol 2,3-dioxygenase-like lactoylglutathione lyase family enzyme
MTLKAGWYTPMLHVKSIEDSIRFYEKLGFTTIDTDRCDPLGWARMHCEGGALMFLRADEEPMEPSKQGVLFVMYTPDLAGLREHLAAQGLKPSPIRHPEYMPSGELSLPDPDGYLLFINHWGEAEHSAWLERTGQPPPG